tara:strand:+ start:32850 stop:33518 length:669 start_codon:yes stop_codon:yes gene_type:complete
MNQYIAIIQRDLLSYYKKKSNIIFAVLFFLMISMLLPFGVGPDLKLLEYISPGLIWVTFFLTIILNAPHLFEDDFKNGSLDQMLLDSENIHLTLMTKIFIFWIAVILPIILFIPLAGMFMGLSLEKILMFVTLIISGSPCLILITAIGSAITIRSRNAGVLIVLLITPFFIPIMIIGTLPFIGNDAINFDFNTSLLLLLALTLFSIALVPYFVAYILKVNNE